MLGYKGHQFSSKSLTELNTPHRIALSVIMPMNRSTKFNHNELVGMKRRVTLFFFNQFLPSYACAQNSYLQLCVDPCPQVFAL